jgi:translation initiation factor IF-2
MTILIKKVESDEEAVKSTKTKEVREKTNEVIANTIRKTLLRIFRRSAGAITGEARLVTVSLVP